MQLSYVEAAPVEIDKVPMETNYLYQKSYFIAIFVAAYAR